MERHFHYSYPSFVIDSVVWIGARGQRRIFVVSKVKHTSRVRVDGVIVVVVVDVVVVAAVIVVVQGEEVAAVVDVLSVVGVVVGFVHDVLDSDELSVDLNSYDWMMEALRVLHWEIV